MSGEVVASIESERPQRIAETAGSIWVSNYEANTVTRIDPATNQVVATIAVGGAPTDVVAGAGSIWVSNRSGGSISRIDPVTNQEIARITVNMAGSASQRIRPGELAAGGDAVWVTDENGSALYRIDPASNAVASHLIFPAGNVVLGDGVLWAAVPDEKVLFKIVPTP